MAGILHRDVSVGNILIVDRPEPDSFTGFIHDFDRSSMTDAPPVQYEGSSDEKVDSDGFVATERTVSMVATLTRLRREY